MNDIKTLTDKYRAMENELETKLADIRDKLSALTKVSEILDEESIPTKTKITLPLAVTTSNKYKNMSMTDAILDLLSSREELTAKEIKNELLRNGLKSSSKSLQGDIYGRLNTLIKTTKVVVLKDGEKLSRYRIATS